MPNDFWLEATGILQFVAGLYAGILSARALASDARGDRATMIGKMSETGYGVSRNTSPRTRVASRSRRSVEPPNPSSNPLLGSVPA